jgi:hypothetical protein
VVFPAPKGPKTTILHLFSSLIWIKFARGSFYHFGKMWKSQRKNSSLIQYPKEQITKRDFNPTDVWIIP